MKFSADIFNTTNTTISIQMKANTGSISFVDIPVNEGMSRCYITYTIPNDSTTLDCKIAVNSNSNDSPIYLDNWCLEKSTSQ